MAAARAAATAAGCVCSEGVAAVASDCGGAATVAGAPSCDMSGVSKSAAAWPAGAANTSQ